jgi:hypothetical protein
MKKPECCHLSPFGAIFEISGRDKRRNVILLSAGDAKGNHSSHRMKQNALHSCSSDVRTFVSQLIRAFNRISGIFHPFHTTNTSIAEVNPLRDKIPDHSQCTLVLDEWLSCVSRLFDHIFKSFARDFGENARPPSGCRLR